MSDLMEVTKNLSRSLDNIAEYSNGAGVLQWENKYKVREYYNRARKFLTIPEIREMFDKVRDIYKTHLGEEGIKRLNEKSE